ncbi:MAG: V-type ATP synthase subunit F [Oscillospiraceae bacterium]|jgi:V/A-type H+-transporting ATPase subunit F|nr:V-type ATP synthase subunit F [Oscillospiraceae bacterium]
MRYFAVSDNVDTLTGLRLAGIEGCVAHDRKEAQAAISGAIARNDVAVLLVTERLAAFCPGLLDDLKRRGTQTVVVEIPDRHGTGRAPDSITRYIRESIGVKV